MVEFGYEKMRCIYPLLIQQFIDDYNLYNGIAVDIGSGPANLSVELCKVTNMEVFLVDNSQEQLSKAREACESIKVDNKLSYINACVENIPIKDNFADFIMCRGSIGFWKSPEIGLNEIYRILKPNAIAIVGVGVGRYMPKTMSDRIYNDMIKRYELNGNINRPTRYTSAQMEEIMNKTDIENYKIIEEDTPLLGCWVEFTK